MNFIEIFQEPGLYTANSFTDGVAIKIETDVFGVNVMSVVIYYKVDDITPNELKMILNENLVNKSYKKVLTRYQLFGEQKNNLFNLIKL